MVQEEMGQPPPVGPRLLAVAVARFREGLRGEAKLGSREAAGASAAAWQVTAGAAQVLAGAQALAGCLSPEQAGLVELAMAELARQGEWLASVRVVSGARMVEAVAAPARGEVAAAAAPAIRWLT